MTNTKKNNSINIEVTQLIKKFNNKIKEHQDSKDNRRSLFIDFYLQHSSSH